MVALNTSGTSPECIIRAFADSILIGDLASSTWPTRFVTAVVVLVVRAFNALGAIEDRCLGWAI